MLAEWLGFAVTSHYRRMDASKYAGYDLTALCLWREARGEGLTGMQAVANVIVNRAARHKSSCDEEAMRPLQFSSMTAPGDAQLLVFPHGADEVWRGAQMLAASAKARTLTDLTHGATMYYAPRGIKTSETILLPGGMPIPFPASWNRHAVEFSTQIGQHLFFREL